MYVSGIIYSRIQIHIDITPHTTHDSLSQISVLKLDNLRAECPQLQCLLPVLGQTAQCPLPVMSSLSSCHYYQVICLQLSQYLPVSSPDSRAQKRLVLSDEW